MTHPFQRDFWRIDHLRTTWEYKSIAFLMRAIVAIVVLFYVFLTLPTLWPWAQTQWVRHQPPERFAELVETARQSGDFSQALFWLQRRPISEAAIFLPTIRDNLAIMPPNFIGWLSDDARQRDDVDDLQFWQMMARYRMRYDLVRCGDPTVVQKVNELINQMSILGYGGLGGDAVLSVEKNPAALANLLQRVLDYDAENPMRNDPALTCATVKGLSDGEPTPAPEHTWAQHRHILRLATEHGIAELHIKAVTEPAPVPETTPDNAQGNTP